MDQECIEQIGMLAKRYDIDKVILFGSRARQENHERSDIDLAVYAAGDISDFIFALETEVATLLEFDVTQISENLDELFLEQITKEGVLLYEKPRI